MFKLLATMLKTLASKVMKPKQNAFSVFFIKILNTMEFPETFIHWIYCRCINDLFQPEYRDIVEINGYTNHYQ